MLDLDPDLAECFPEEQAGLARDRLLVPVESLGRGSLDDRLGPLEGGGRFGLLVLDGLIMREVQLAGSTSAELLGQGDLLRPWDIDGEDSMPIPSKAHWHALIEVRVAVLGPDFMRRASGFPEVLSELTGRSVHRSKGLMLGQAIGNLKHVEARLLLLFWHLAARWGRVGPSAISLELPLTHEMLGKLVGATRPSVTTALGQLDRRGLLERSGDQWRLRRDADEALRALSGD